MKSLFKFNVLLLALAVAASAIADEPDGMDTYTVKADASEIKWHASKVTGAHTGAIQFSEGVLTFSGDRFTGGSFVVDMSTITCTDLTNADLNRKLVGHLKSDDFFGVEQHPYSMLEITEAKHISDNEYQLLGDITIKDITQPVVFNAEVIPNENGIRATGKLVLDRSKFDVRYNSGSFFDNLGDKLIYDDFELHILLKADKGSSL